MKPLYNLRFHLRMDGGFTLIELMIALVLGLLVIGGVVSVIIANNQSYRTNEGLSQVQEGARTSFELLARDIRQSGDTGCGNPADKVVNVINIPTDKRWWRDWDTLKGLRALDGETETYGVSENKPVAFGTGTGQRVAGTHALLLQGTEDTGVFVDTHTPGSTNFKINGNTADLNIENGDILVVCDIDHPAIFQVSSHDSTNIGHATGIGTPGNACTGLDYKVPCSTYSYKRNSQILRFAATTWYIGYNGRGATCTQGGCSLYRTRLGSGASLQTEEIVPGIVNMQFQLREEGGTDFQDVEDVTNWATVDAIQVVISLLSTDARISVDPNDNAGRLGRAYSTIISLRNRNE